MSNPEHLVKLKEGVQAWNLWRESNPEIKPDLSRAKLCDAKLSGVNLSAANLRGANFAGADLSGADLSSADLHGAHVLMAKLCGANLSSADLGGANLNYSQLSGAKFRGANIYKALLCKANLDGADLSQSHLGRANLVSANLSSADLRWTNLGSADLSGAQLKAAKLNAANLNGAYLYKALLCKASLDGADLTQAHLSGAKLRGAKLRGANLYQADLREANLSEADLSEASLIRASLIGTNFKDANLTGCSVYGISVWSARLDGAKQRNLLITNRKEPAIRVDSLEVAQFIYLLLNNAKIRHVIDTITSKVVLILGRFTQERKVVLDAIREELRKRDYVPILFDFEKPTSKDLTGTISTLANMARFIIADLTDPSSVPHELATLAPTIVVPVQTLLLKGQREYAMFRDLVGRHHWVLEPYQYKSLEQLLDQLNEQVIGPAEAKAKELRSK